MPGKFRLFDEFVGGGEQRCWHSEAKRLGSLEIDDQLVFGRRLHRKIGRLLASEDTIGIRRRTPVLIHDIRTVGDQAAKCDGRAGPIDSRDTVARRKRGNLRTMSDREGIWYDDQTTVRLACLSGNEGL